MVIHFPIALLLVCPLLLIMGLIFKTHSRGFFYSALLICFLGTMGAWVAVYSGYATATAADRPQEILDNPSQLAQLNHTLGNHARMAIDATWYFTVMTLLLAANLFIPNILKRNWPPKFQIIIPVIIIILLWGGGLIIAQTGHLGGILVHHFGLKAPLTLDFMEDKPTVNPLEILQVIKD